MNKILAHVILNYFSFSFNFIKIEKKRPNISGIWVIYLCKYIFKTYCTKSIFCLFYFILCLGIQKPAKLIVVVSFCFRVRLICSIMQRNIFIEIYRMEHRIKRP